MLKDNKLSNTPSLFWAYVLFASALIVSNLLGAKMVHVCGLSMPAGTIGYCATFLITDVVGELWGKKAANDLVFKGFVCLLFCLALIRIALLLPAASPCDSFDQVFDVNSRVICGSIVAYLASQFLDVAVFHKLREVLPARKFVRNNVSTLISQFFDTSIFVVIAFGGAIDDIVGVIWGTYAAKAVLAAFDTPFFYLLTRRSA